MEDNLVVLFCIVDEFCKEFYPEYEKTLIAQGTKKRRRPSLITPSEIITIFIYLTQTPAIYEASCNHEPYHEQRIRCI